MQNVDKSFPQLIIEAHGINNAVQAETGSMARKFWTVVLFIMFGIALVEMVKLVYEFSNHPDMLKTTFVPANSIKLPEIAVCLKHPWDFDAINSSSIVKDFIFKFREQLSQNDSELAQSEVEFSDIVNNDSEHFYRQYGLNCEQWFKFCRFKGNVFNCCSPAVAKRYLSQLHYVCQVFRTNDNQTDLSMENAFMTLVKVRDREFVEADFDEVPALHDMYIGLPVIFAHEFRELKKNMIIAPPGFATFISISSWTNELKSNCASDRPRYFTANGCYYACENVAIIEHCGCRPYAFLDNPSVDYWVDANQTKSLCNPVGLKRCMRKIGHNFSRSTNDCYSATCQFPCLCNEESTDTSVTHGNLDESWLKRVTNDDSASVSHYALISVMHDRIGHNLNYEVVIATVDSYVSLLGGQLGLWLGCSLITVIQLIVTGVQFVFKNMTHRMRMVTNVPIDESSVDPEKLGPLSVIKVRGNENSW